MGKTMQRIPMIFPGQGSQAVGMAQDLAAGSGAAADFLASVNEVLGEDLTSIMFDGPESILTETRNAQPAILAHSVAVVLALRQRGLEPSIVAGHSLGEFSAAVAAGALSPADGLRVVRKRGELMFAAGQERPGTMAAVLGLAADQVDAVCREVAATAGVVVLANHNSAAQVAISGEISAVEAAMAALKEAGAKRVVPLKVSGAFHSPLLIDAAREFTAFLSDIPIADPAVPLITNVNARPATTADELRRGFAGQLTAPVLWQDSLQEIVACPAQAPSLVLEVGPGRVLSNLARRAYPEVVFQPIGTLADLDGVDAVVAADRH